MLFLWFPFSSFYLVLIYEIFFSFSSISLLSIRFYFTSSCYFAISSLSFYISVLWWFLILLGFPSGSDSKESAFSVGDLCSFPLLGRSPGEGNGYQLQYSGLENSMGSQRIRHDWVTFTSLYSVFRACLWSCLASSFLSLLVSVPLPTNHFLFQQYFLINDLHSSSFLGLLLRKPDKNQPTHSSRTERLCSATERCQDLDSEIGRAHVWTPVTG